MEGLDRFQVVHSVRTARCLDQVLATGDGVTKVFSLTKRYASGAQSYLRPINKPVSGTVQVAVAGRVLKAETDFTVDVASGTLSLVAAPIEGAFLTAGFEYDVPVRFDTDRITASLAGFAAGEIPSIPVVEVRV